MPHPGGPVSRMFRRRGRSWCILRPRLQKQNYYRAAASARKRGQHRSARPAGNYMIFSLVPVSGLPCDQQEKFRAAGDYEQIDVAAQLSTVIRAIILRENSTRERLALLVAALMWFFYWGYFLVMFPGIIEGWWSWKRSGGAQHRTRGAFYLLPGRESSQKFALKIEILIIEEMNLCDFPLAHGVSNYQKLTGKHQSA